MTFQPVTEFYVMHFSADGHDPTTTDEWRQAVEALKQARGCERVRFGQKLEDGSTGVLAVEWGSHTAAESFSASSYFPTWLQQLTAPYQHLMRAGASPPMTTFRARSAAGDRAAALAGPCTEVFTGFGAEPGFLAQVRRFAEAVDAERPRGYRASAVVEVTTPMAKASGGEVGSVVMLLVGWDSREAHLEAKGKPGSIEDNIHELRSLRKEADLFHVNLTEQ